MAVDHFTGKLIMPPQSVDSEAEYNEQYLLWMGPVSVKKYLNKGDRFIFYLFSVARVFCWITEHRAVLKALPEIDHCRSTGLVAEPL